MPSVISLTEAPLQRVGEAHLVAHQLAQRRAQFLGDALGRRRGGDAARLGVADQAFLAAAQLQADLRQLGGLAGTGFAADDDDLMAAAPRRSRRGGPRPAGLPGR
jgi:hypothetical protein